MVGYDLMEMVVVGGIAIVIVDPSAFISRFSPETSRFRMEGPVRVCVLRGLLFEGCPAG